MPIVLTGQCPRCNSDLEVRYSPKNGCHFIGCVGFPSCRYTHPYDEALEELHEHIQALEDHVQATMPRTHLKGQRRKLPKGWRVV